MKLALLSLQGEAPENVRDSAAPLVGSAHLAFGDSWRGPERAPCILHSLDPKLLSSFRQHQARLTNHQHNGQICVRSARLLTNFASLTSCSPHSISQKDIEVPETILKKQKANQKVNDQRAADTQKKREVR
jgi:hypothetical protein